MIKVLLVDDEPLVRRGIRSIMPLSDFGMEWAGEASTAEEALKALDAGGIDLVLTDISMPGMDGLAFIRKMQTDHPSVRSVVITCHQDFDYLQQALRLGAVDYIVKTQLDDDSVHDLLGRISRHVERHAEAERTELDPSIRKRLAERWSSLHFVAREELYEALSADTLRVFDAASWKELLTYCTSGEWQRFCPLLAPEIDRASAQLGTLHSIPELLEWVELFRDAAMHRLCLTMYSEQVIASIMQAIDLLRGAEDGRWSQSDICKQVGMSVSYFSKCFKEIVGVSFVYYVQEMNLRHAQLLLEATNLPIYEVADKSGFSDEKYFGKIFRTKLGCSPSEYRLQSRSKR
ncbi:response regulator [Paenibacillus sp. PAMC21692]|uniref:response regulator n=1 Tax=Paenibacillus sp. PAMC21692 TaxID=2762320 RepID=UPI00164D347C|nr:response regulator [Paenibacillus sp. PAMC21692]QNK58994.1 response regulator [Paenibacillus sp. PAMC21692]